MITFLFVVALFFVVSYWRLRATDIIVPPNAEQFDPNADDWRSTILQPVIYIQPRKGQIIPRA